MKKRIRNCSAYEMTAEDANISAIQIGGVIECEIWPDDLVLKSYNSIVAILHTEKPSNNKVLCLLPRHDYSITTISHIRKWMEDKGYTFQIKRARTIPAHCNPPVSFVDYYVSNGRVYKY